MVLRPRLRSQESRLRKERTGQRRSVVSRRWVDYQQLHVLMNMSSIQHCPQKNSNSYSVWCSDEGWRCCQGWEEEVRSLQAATMAACRIQSHLLNLFWNFELLYFFVGFELCLCKVGMMFFFFIIIYYYKFNSLRLIQFCWISVLNFNFQACL